MQFITYFAKVAQNKQIYILKHKLHLKILRLTYKLLFPLKADSHSQNAQTREQNNDTLIKEYQIVTFRIQLGSSFGRRKKKLILFYVVFHPLQNLVNAK